MKNIPATKLCIAVQAFALLIPVTLFVTGSKEHVTSEVLGLCLAVAAFSKATEGILKKTTNISIFELPAKEGVGDFWLGVLFWVGFGLFWLYLAFR